MYYEVPTYPSELGFDPEAFPIWRPRQAQTVEKIVNSKKKLFVVSAPTGSGKSLTAAAIGRLAEREGRKTAILTHRKFLQDQYMSLNHDSVKITQAIGRSNFPCILEDHEHLTADVAPCVDGFMCKHKGDGTCPYYYQRNVADHALLKVLNYPIFLETARSANAEDANLNILTNFDYFRHNQNLICDEGHRADKEILSVVSATITPKDFTFLNTLGIKVPKVANLSLKHNPHLLTWANHAANVVSADMHRIRTDPSYRGGGEDRFTSALVAARMDQLRKVNNKLGKINVMQKSAAAVQFESTGSLRFRPVLSEQWAEPLLLKHAEKTVLMSATIFGAEYWAERMGVDIDDVEYLDVPSNFPKENRPIFFSPVVGVNYKIWSEPEKLNTLVAAIDRIIAGYLPHKGIIHTANKKLANTIKEMSKFRHLMFVGGAEVIEDFKAAKFGILVSYSATEGVDLPDDLCRYVIFAKVPWLPKDDPVIQLQSQEIPGFYEYEAASEVVQGVGRGMRHENDWCVSFILDSSWKMLKNKTWHMLPEWFKEAYDEAAVPPLPVKK